MEQKAIELIDKLITGWSNWESEENYYLTVLAPAIVRSDPKLLTDKEQEIATALWQLLSPDELQRLPELIRERHYKKLEEIASNRAKREARHEVERREAEEKRRRDEALAAREPAFRERLELALKKDFIGADAVFSADPDSKLFTSQWYKDLKTDFVIKWVRRELSKKLQLDREQAEAVADVGGNSLIIARAGSGKTRTLVARSVFLQRHCGVLPSELLLLAFNNAAAAEMKERLAAETIDDHLPHVMTFHALAYALVHPEEKIMFDDKDADQMRLSREIQNIIDEHIRSQEYGDRIRDLMLAHFRDDWEVIVDGHFHLQMDEFLDYRRALPRESLKGDFVRSFGERLIANTLFEYGVDYKYERNFHWNDFNYRPDFTIPLGAQSGVIIEYFGLQDDSDYDEMSSKKRAFWKGRDNWRFLEYNPTDITRHGADAFVATLVQALRDAGISCERRSEEEIWKLVRKRAIDRFTSAVRTFVGRCRKRNLDPDDVTELVAAHTPCSISEESFLEVGTAVYRCYLQRLDDLQKEDFDGLMWRSVQAVRNGQTRFVRYQGRERGDLTTLRYVMIDEFQDFSEMFYKLINAIHSITPRVRYFCVGDDWQAINAFAGSDLRFFEDFSQYFSDTSHHHIRTNYRSPKTVVEIGNALMVGLGKPARADRSDTGWVRLCDLKTFKPSEPENAEHNGDNITPALLRIVRALLDRGLEVVMLSRRYGLPWYVNYSDGAVRFSDALKRFLEHVRSYLPEEDRGRVSISVAHRYKGLEHTAVVILDATDRSYPLIHPDWIFLRLFGDSIEHILDEERRLFYVAITRAVDSLAVLTDTSAHPSPFLTDIHNHTPMRSLRWKDLSPVPSLNSPRLEVRVYDAYEVRDQLKDCGYRWDAGAKCWRRAYMAEGFSFNELLEQAWAGRVVRIEIYSAAGKLLHKK